MISVGSCDTEDWSNDAENSALITGINYILKYIHQYYVFFVCVYFCKCSFGEHNILLLKTLKILPSKILYIYYTIAFPTFKNKTKINK